jgi:AcrR family transcriptional regulator
MTEGGARRGRPRDSTADQRILDVAWDLLVTRGYPGLAVDEVAERAAVAKTTLYRRWPTKDHLAVAVATRILGEVPIPDTGDLRADLTSFTAALAASLDRVRRAGQPDGGASAGLLAELVAAAARHPDIGAAVRAGFAQRHALARARLQRAVEHEGLPADTDAAILIDQLAGPIYYRILITGAPVGRGYAESLVDATLAGAINGRSTRHDDQRHHNP